MRQEKRQKTCAARPYRRRPVARALVVGMLAITGAIEAMHVPALAADRPEIERLRTFLARLDADVVASRADLNRAFDAGLVDEDAGHFITSRAFSVRLGGIPVREIELRAPSPGATVTAGPILILLLDPAAGVCIPVADLRAAYPDLISAGPASPHDMDPDETLERREGAARLFFGFPVSGPDCLRGVVYRFDEPVG
jgi:hypothetical protein